ncbi:TetR/AcrR family transcriptional regulator [Turneriella parva]|uniref:Transcriptional regulator, TetR family n=1 Tax=Turneriella parva (strain ATCC BAA-1111 / DSM 21527 / NCTC 11395 / H) TaxID=869212 RepID=I4B3A9_TURPD|nr:TetR/AcrR family transcriptional regulator [Turneriella parva]AFM11766.1 transcriptional regulator, TetR family [Turneriella parva DSM 21527]
MKATAPSPTRQIILEKAGALFYRHGFNNTGMDEITRVVGVKKPALYYHFESKNALGNAYIEYRAHMLFEMLDSLLARAGSLDKYLSSWATALIMLARRGEFYGCPFTAFASELAGDERPYFEVTLGQVEAQWLRVQEMAYQKFYPQGRYAAEVARKILIVHTGCVMLYRASRDEKYLRQLKAEFAAVAKSAAEKR